MPGLPAYHQTGTTTGAFNAPDSPQGAGHDVRSASHGVGNCNVLILWVILLGLIIPGLILGGLDVAGFRFVFKNR